MLNRARLFGAICTLCVLLAASGCPHQSARVGVGSPGGVEIRIDPSAVAVSPGGSQTFTCTVTGSMNTGCSWQVTEANGGSVTGTGAYVAPSGVGSYHVVATANADTTKTATATVVVTAPSAPDVWTNVTPSSWVPPGSCGGQPCNDDFGFQDILVDPTRQSDIYAYTCYQGVYKSTDFGATFTKIPGSLDVGKLWAGAIASDGSFLLAGVGNGAAPGLYRSDRTASGLGASWRQIFGPAEATSLGISAYSAYSVDIDPSNNQHFVFTFHSNDGYCGLVETFDGGTTYRKHDGPSGFGCSQSIFFITSQIWLVEAQDNGGVDGTWRTTTAGLVSSSPSPAAWTRVSLAEHPHGAGQLHNAGGGVLFLPSKGNGLSPAGINLSRDYGATWTNVFNGGCCQDEGLVVGTAKHIYAGTPWIASFVSGSLDGSAWSSTTGFTTTAGSLAGGVKRFGVVFDGRHSIVIGGMWDAGLWRYVEP